MMAFHVGTQTDEPVVRAAELIVIGSSLYWHNICDPVRTLLDHFAQRYGLSYLGMATNGREAARRAEQIG